MKNLSILLLILSLQQNSAVAQSWMPVDGDVVSSGVHGFAIWNDNLIIGGSFGDPCGRITEWDSVSYSCIDSGVGLVARAAIEYEQDLVVVGDFWNVKQPCTDCNGVVRWDGTQWMPMGTGFNNDVLSLTVWNGELIAGGAFKLADGATCKRVAHWDGSGWSSMGGLDTAVHGQVRALAVYDNELWIGGDFYVDSCTNCTYVAKWTGTAWENVDIPNGLMDTVRAFYVDEEQNKLYMGGHFTELEGDSNANGIAVYDGTSWSALGTGVAGKGDYVRAITKYNGNIIIGGYFSHVDESINAKRVAKWNPNTNTWSSVGDGLKNGYVRALKEYKGELYAGGSFNISDTVSVNYIAKWYETPLVESVGDVPEKELFELFPNPTTSILTIVARTPGSGKHDFSLTSILGKTLIYGEMRSNSITVDLTGLSNGIYILRLTNADGIQLTKRVIKSAQY